MELFWQRLDQGIKGTLPAVSALLMSLLGSFTWPFPNLSAVMPPLVFVALYYWSAHRPDLFPAGAAFGFGLLHDVINGLPLGVSALLFTLAHRIIWQQRRFFTGHSFLMFWSGFALAAFVLMLAQWAALCLVRWDVVPTAPALIQTMLAILIFPLPCWLFNRLQRNVLSAG